LPVQQDEVQNMQDDFGSDLEEGQAVGSALDRIRFAKQQAELNLSSSDDDDDDDEGFDLTEVPTMDANASPELEDMPLLRLPLPLLTAQVREVQPLKRQIQIAKERQQVPIAVQLAIASPRPSTPSLPIHLAAAKKPAVPSKKQRRDPMEDERINNLVATVLQHWQPEHNSKVEFCEEQDTKNAKTDPEFYQVAKWIVLFKGKPREERLDVANFSSSNIRKLALACGVKGGGNLTIFNARRKIAQSILSGSVYTDATIANPRTTAAERKINTNLRITNACFLPSKIQQFIELNDKKYRADYEKAHGSDPIKDFWISISELVNDGTNNPELGTVLESRQEDDVRLAEFVATGNLNLNDFVTGSYKSCQQTMNDIMKAREECMKQMRVSGHHSNDLWTYAINTKLTTLRKSSPPVPAIAVYYCHVLCMKNPGIDGKFSAFLSEALKSDCNTQPIHIRDSGSQTGLSHDVT
jgi:hypothetical protein